MATTRTGKLSELTPDHSNANRGTERGRYALEASLRKYGAGRSILIDRNGRIIAGNKTAETAADVGIDDVIVVQTDGRQVVAVQRTDLDLDSNEARELAYADNRVGQLDLDFDPAQILADLNAGVNLDQFWRKDELDELLADLQPKTTGDTPAEVDRAEELRQKWGVKSGDLWSLDSGNGHGHLLVCGDCTDASTVARVMGGDVAELLFTSPPYADMREYDGGDLSVGKLAEFIPTFKPHARYQVVNLGIKRDGGQVVQYWDTYIAAAQSCGYKLLSWNVWDQGQNGAVGKLTAMFPIEHEWIFVFGESVKDLVPTVPNKDAGNIDAHVYDRQSSGQTVKKGAIKIRPMREIGTVTRVYPQLARNVDTSHPAMFPTEIVETYTEAMTRPGDIVAEPFSGSGTVIIACENLARRCRACEISPAYVAVALERWSVHTGRQPVLVDI